MWLMMRKRWIDDTCHLADLCEVLWKYDHCQTIALALSDWTKSGAEENANFSGHCTCAAVPIETLSLPQLERHCGVDVNLDR
jgi:hypothetical protein